jgi:PilZ domain
MSFFRRANPTGMMNASQGCRPDRREMRRVETEARLVITTLIGEVHLGVMRNMNAEAIAARVDTDLEPGNRVTLSYHTNDPEDRIEIQAIVRRRNGFYYVFDTRLVDLVDSSRCFC